jgi:hypothetical protein
MFIVLKLKMNKTTLDFVVGMNSGTITRTAPAQLITRMAEYCKDKNFYKPVKFCRDYRAHRRSCFSNKKTLPVEGAGFYNY